MGEEEHYTETRKMVKVMKEKYGDLPVDLQKLHIMCKKEQAIFLSKLGARNEGYQIVKTEADKDVKTIGISSKNREENKYESRTLYPTAKYFITLLEILEVEMKTTEGTVDSYNFKEGEKTKKKVKEQRGEKW